MERGGPVVLAPAGAGGWVAAWPARALWWSGTGCAARLPGLIIQGVLLLLVGEARDHAAGRKQGAGSRGRWGQHQGQPVVKRARLPLRAPRSRCAAGAAASAPGRRHARSTPHPAPTKQPAQHPPDHKVDGEQQHHDGEEAGEAKAKPASTKQHTQGGCCGQGSAEATGQAPSGDRQHRLRFRLREAKG